MLLNDGGTTYEEGVFRQLLPLCPAALGRYVAEATDDDPKRECLDFSREAVAWFVAVGIYVVGWVLDETAHHSYLVAQYFSERLGRYKQDVVEPQLNVVVPRAYPAHHYVGDVRAKVFFY